MRIQHRRHGGQARRLNQPCEALDKGDVHPAQQLREPGRHHHAAAHRFAVQPRAVSHTGLDGVTEGVPEVQDGAQPGFTLVLPYHPGLDLAAAFDRVGQSTGISRGERFHVPLDPVEEGHVGNRAVLDHFGQPCTEFAGGQGGERVQVAEHPLRLVKSPDHVFAQRVVDGRLATDR